MMEKKYVMTKYRTIACPRAIFINAIIAARDNPNALRTL